MRDVDLMLRLLRQMSIDPMGRTSALQTLGMSDDDQSRFHNIEILVDVGHVEWVSDSRVRITNDGYDFVNAIDKNTSLRAKLAELLQKGKPFADAARIIIALMQQGE